MALIPPWRTSQKCGRYILKKEQLINSLLCHRLRGDFRSVAVFLLNLPHSGYREYNRRLETTQISWNKSMVEIINKACCLFSSYLSRPSSTGDGMFLSDRTFCVLKCEYRWDKSSFKDYGIKFWVEGETERSSHAE